MAIYCFCVNVLPRKELMGQTFYFEIPEIVEVKTKLTVAIPSYWAWVDGVMSAPDHLKASGNVAEYTGYQLSRFHDIHPTIREMDKHMPDLYGMIAENKLPDFISFEEAGYESKIVTLELAKRVVIAYLGRGYGGHLSFYKGCHRNVKHDNPARCEMIFQSWEGAPFQRPESGKQPARIKLEWDERYGGKTSDIEPILSACYSLGLREYVPVEEVTTV
jgi:hypothetical protein